MLRIGLTGGIASGKSTVAKQFAALGASIIDTDQVAREVVAPGQPGLNAIAAKFGNGVLGEDGQLDRKAMRTLVFGDAEKLEQLESILHPLIRARCLELAANATGPYLLFEVPLLVETGFGELVHRVLVVDCPPEAQLARLMQRDGMSTADATQMINSQIDRATRLAAADDVILNDGDPAQLAAAVRDLHSKYLALIISE